MMISLEAVSQELNRILQKIKSGELADGCCVSTIQSPVKEAWEVTESITSRGSLHEKARESLFNLLNDKSRELFQATGYDDFDLIYEYLLQETGSA